MRASITPHSPARFPAAAAAAVTAVIHLWQFGSTWAENALVGVGFLVLAAACAVCAAALVIRGTGPAWLALAAVCAAATAGYAVSRTIGLPGMPDDVGNWLEPAGVAAVASQLLAVAVAAAALRRAGTVTARAARPASALLPQPVTSAKES